MSITSLRPIFRATAQPILSKTGGDTQFGIALLHARQISDTQYLAALAGGGRLIDSLIRTGAMDVRAVYAAISVHYAVGIADLADMPPDPVLMAQADGAQCLLQSWVPWRRLGQTTVIVCAYPEDFAKLRGALVALFGPVIMAIAPRSMIETAVLAQTGKTLARRAEMRVPAADSCRNYTPQRLNILLAALTLGGILAAYFVPEILFLGVLMTALAIMHMQSALKILAITARTKPADLHPHPAAPLPTISIMVALYKESRIVARLIRRLENLDYPRNLLDVIFVIEDNDTATITALGSLVLPPWLRVLPVPTGTIRTKPRALNYGLDHCRGSIVGVYDAEDAPPPNQLRRVAAQFQSGDAQLACIQGRLDFYNPHSNWLARCFTIEYAAWWRLFLPGIERLGLAIPLGGTTLFFRHAALLDLGGWDAHNVTEDADLGLRIARRGYRTKLIDSTTMEEANCQTLPWIKQRSRWIKGYMITWGTHMRDPARLLRDLGLRRFVGFQVMFAGSVLQALLAPILWVMWLAPFGYFDPALALLPPHMLLTIAISGAATEAFVMICNYAGIRKTQHKINVLWLPLMIIYHMLASFAAYKALWEMLSAPFYWDKTSHGVFDT